MNAQSASQLYEKQYQQYLQSLVDMRNRIWPWADVAEELIDLDAPESKAHRQALLDFLRKYFTPEVRLEACKIIVSTEKDEWLRQATMLFPGELTQACFEGGIMDKLENTIQDLQQHEALEFLNKILLEKYQGRDLINLVIRRVTLTNASILMEKHPNLAASITQEARDKIIAQLGHGEHSSKIKQKLLELVALEHQTKNLTSTPKKPKI